MDLVKDNILPFKVCFDYNYMCISCLLSSTANLLQAKMKDPHHTIVLIALRNQFHTMTLSNEELNN